MSLRTRLAALLKRRQAGETMRIRMLSLEERTAKLSKMFDEMARATDSEHAAQFNAAITWFLENGGHQHKEAMRIMQAVCLGPLSEADLKTINYSK